MQQKLTCVYVVCVCVCVCMPACRYMVYALVSVECVYEHLFETGPNYVVQVGLELAMILHLPLPLRC